MGGENSKNEIYENALAALNAKERLQIDAMFSKMCQNRGLLKKENLQCLTKPYLSATASNNLHRYMCGVDPEHNAEEVATRNGFLITLAHAIKSSHEERRDVFITMAHGNMPSDATLGEIKELVGIIIEGYTHSLQNDSSNLAKWNFKLTEMTHCEKLLKTILSGLVSTDSAVIQKDLTFPDLSTTYSKDQIEAWLSRNALLISMFHTVMHSCFPISSVDSIGSENIAAFPLCKDYDGTKSHSLLDLQSLIYINSRLLFDLRKEWKLLFSSNVHGESFYTMHKRIVDKGPSVIIIKDTKGHVFGGFAAESWRANSKFYGSQQCFLFSLSPNLEAYYSTGYNDHYMYINHGQETLPNGLGMGGQFGYCGLWLDEEYGKGHSKAQPRCITYNSPQLSGDSEFTIEAIEVWRVGPDKKKDEDENASGFTDSGSILDKDPEAKAMLSLIDKGPHSEGLREKDALADFPEEHQVPHK